MKLIIEDFLVSPLVEKLKNLLGSVDEPFEVFLTYVHTDVVGSYGPAGSYFEIFTGAAEPVSIEENFFWLSTDGYYDQEKFSFQNLNELLEFIKNSENTRTEVKKCGCGGSIYEYKHGLYSACGTCGNS